jgi:bifunctional N-acetylglucosamine-1-phosphate-uridyltransferase/glucosamine-1-phosphate-acetyltransferase GlmU-like protein
MQIDVIILAAGEGSACIQRFQGVASPRRPSASGPVLDTARALAPRKVIVVHGHGGDEVKRLQRRERRVGRAGAAAGHGTRRHAGAAARWIAVRCAGRVRRRAAGSGDTLRRSPTPRAAGSRSLQRATQPGWLWARPARRKWAVERIVEHKDASPPSAQCAR